MQFNERKYMELMSTNEITPADFDDLIKANKLLYSPTLTAKISQYVGKPIESLFENLPNNYEKKIADAVKGALEKASDFATWKMDNKVQEASNKTHKWFAGASGAIGGFFGITAILIELPISTVIMMRSIVDVARSEGFDITQEEVQKECLKVFGLGGSTKEDDESSTGYFAVRAALAETVNKGVAEILVKVAARFSIVVTEKVAAQLVPVIGAASGAVINVMFTDFYQDMARGHFIVKRLENQYGSELVEATSKQIREKSQLEMQTDNEKIQLKAKTEQIGSN